MKYYNQEQMLIQEAARLLHELHIKFDVTYYDVVAVQKIEVDGELDGIVIRLKGGKSIMAKDGHIFFTRHIKHEDDEVIYGLLGNPYFMQIYSHFLKTKNIKEAFREWLFECNTEDELMAKYITIAEFYEMKDYLEIKEELKYESKV